MYAEQTQKQCTKCKEMKEIFEFNKNKKRKDGLHAWCKDCMRVGKREAYLKNKEKYNALNKVWRDENKDLMEAYVAKYRASEKGKANRRVDNKKRYDSGYRKAFAQYRNGKIKQATPSWVDRKEIAFFYKNRPEGHHVDHIIPICGKSVSGLNVPWNLQYLPAHENLKKSNKL